MRCALGMVTATAAVIRGYRWNRGHRCEGPESKRLGESEHAGSAGRRRTRPFGARDVEGAPKIHFRSAGPSQPIRGDPGVGNARIAISWMQPARREMQERQTAGLVAGGVTRR